jgi:hypothetical protein
VLNDAPNWLPTTASGGAYIASLWVRSDSPGAKLTLKLREYRKDTGALVGSASNAVTLNSSWQQIAVTYTPLARGASTLDYTASVGSVPAGSVCFYADDAAIAATPAAALTLTPGTADAPLTVHADASASTGSNAPIASYTFNFGYGPDFRYGPAVVGPQAAPTADWTYYSGGTYTVSVTGTDTDGRASTTTQQITTAERVIDGSFEANLTAGWDTEGSSPGVTFTRVLHSHDGHWAADLENGATAGATCVLNDQPNWITTTDNGQYTASLWARAADLTGANVPLTLTLREYRKDTGALLGSASSTITLKATNWKQASLTYTPVAPGASTLDSTCFYADQASIAYEPPPTGGP